MSLNILELKRAQVREEILQLQSMERLITQMIINQRKAAKKL